MLRPRIIPCLLIHDRGLVKTTRFKDPKYVGDPINAVKIFNEKEVDELTVLDIDATVNGVEPDYKLIKILASQCRMPLCYGGGVKTVEQAKKIVQAGVEKVAISAAAVEKPDLITDIADAIGSQSVVVVLDVKKRLLGRKFDVFTHNGKRRAAHGPVELALMLEKAGAGEIVINHIDREGTQGGIDLDLMAEVKSVLSIPFTAMGGVGSREDFKNAIERMGIIGVASGSFFVFKGPYKAVLISYIPEEFKRVLAGVAHGLR